MEYLSNSQNNMNYILTYKGTQNIVSWKSKILQNSISKMIPFQCLYVLIKQMANCTLIAIEHSSSTLFSFRCGRLNSHAIHKQFYIRPILLCFSFAHEHFSHTCLPNTQHKCHEYACSLTEHALSFCVYLLLT